MWLNLVAIAIGAVLGAWGRYGLSLWLNPTWTYFPLGTWCANVLGAYLIGLALVFFAQYLDLSPAYRLAVVTGFLGALTTFSSFSLEVVSLIQVGRWGFALAVTAAHVVGSLVCTVLGMMSMHGLLKSIH